MGEFLKLSILGFFIAGYKKRPSREELFVTSAGFFQDPLSSVLK
jgi:hypothetical protein